MVASCCKEIMRFFFGWHIISDTSVIEKNSSSGSLRLASLLDLSRVSEEVTEAWEADYFGQFSSEPIEIRLSVFSVCFD